MAAGLFPVSAAQFYVAPWGDDRDAGTDPDGVKGKRNGPFATLTRARDAVRDLKRTTGGRLQEEVNIMVRGGTYFLTAPFVLRPEDSGTAQHPIRFIAFPNEQPVLSGGLLVTGWQTLRIEGKLLWRAQLTGATPGQVVGSQLFVRGERRPRSRHPNQGYFQVAAVPEALAETKWSDGQASFQFRAGDVQTWAGWERGEVRVMNRWVESHLPIAGVDMTNHVLRFGRRSVFKLEAGDQYYIENIPQTLDTPGEWCWDRRDGSLLYWPLAGEEPSRTEVIVPQLSQVVEFQGDPAQDRQVAHIHFQGLTFAHTDWNFPAGFAEDPRKPEIWPVPSAAVGGFAQAAIGVPGAVRGDGMVHCVFARCEFKNLGTYAIEMARGCQGNMVSNCVLRDLGAGGVKLGETVLRTRPADLTFGNAITDSLIQDGGKIFHSAVGVWIGQSFSNRLAHCSIHDFYYTGVSVGWTWGYGPAAATNNLVEWNEVHHLGRKANGDGPILSDMGGIYTLGRHAGTVIRNNVWHDIQGVRYGGWGIYFDEGTTGILAENNLVYRTSHGGFHQHYGRENLVRNNIFAYAREWQIQRTRAEPHLSFAFTRNIVLWRAGKLFDGNFTGTNLVMDSNVYWREGGGEIRFDGLSFTDWQRQRGQDAKSIVADPLLTETAEGRFRLRAATPVAQVGFKPFDMSRVGPRSEPGRSR